MILDKFHMICTIFPMDPFKHDHIECLSISIYISYKLVFYMSDS